jgi:hypothetical protein
MPSLDPFTIQPLTLLDAVNVVLGSIGRNAIMTLEGINLNSDGESALKQVHNWSMQIQMEGWHWNTEPQLVLNPGDDGRIEVPLNTLKFDTVGESALLDLTWRGKYLYNRETHTYVIGQSVSADLIVGLDFEEVPQAARTYITMKAARSFAQFKLGSGATNQFTQQDVGEAYLKLLELEDEADDRTLQDTNGRIARRRNKFHQG